MRTMITGLSPERDGWTGMKWTPSLERDPLGRQVKRGENLCTEFSVIKIILIVYYYSAYILQL